MPRAEADAALAARISEGQRLLAWAVHNDADYQALDDEHTAWTGYNTELLRRMFTTTLYQQIYGARFGYSISAQPTFRDREQLLKDSFIREQISRLNSVRRRLPLIPEAGQAAPASQTAIDQRTFDFVAEYRLRMIIVADYREAQVAFDAGAYKAAALLAASVIEGLFLDVLRRPSIMQASNYAHATNRLRRGGDSINWDRVDLVSLADAAKELGLLHVSVDHLGRGVADFRDTIHPQNELTRGRRPQREEAAVLIHLIPLLSRDFEALS